MREKKTARRFLIAGLTLLAVALTACGGGPAQGGAASPAAAQGQAEKKQPVRVGYINVLDDAPALLAMDAGLYEKHGLKAELQQFKSGTDLIKALVGGQVDVGVLGFTNAVTWAAQGADVKVVGGAQMGYHSILARKDSGIKGVSDLKGKRLATQKQGSTADIVLNGVVLPKAGLTRDDVQMVFAEPAVAIQSLAAGQVDAAFVFEPFDRIASLTSPVERVYEVGQAWPFPCMVTITSGKLLQSNRDLVNRVLDAQKEAITMLEQKPAEAAGHLAPRFIAEPELKTQTGAVPAAKVMEEAIAAQTFNWEITPEQIKRMEEIIQIMVDQKAVERPVAVDTVLDLSWQKGK